MDDVDTHDVVAYLLNQIRFILWKILTANEDEKADDIYECEDIIVKAFCTDIHEYERHFILVYADNDKGYDKYEPVKRHAQML